ncbi:hypothetical protein [Emticicia sp. BO119]|uniref:hypothetical protein n=1 Tax=Emticicia sp. BO119 TaxID=2757768 RepID=UPI0015F105EE|nr:hypothetical protein [Emticicia sp. BO119]MBA4850913.1 hypothetical protein [Emticicia sp. BO119]
MNLFFLIPTGAFIVVVFWVALLKMIAHLSGWDNLKNTYETTYTHNEINYFGVSGKVGKFYYNRILNVSLSEAGLFLSVSPLFRFGHPFLLIPWSDIKNIHEKGKTLFCEVNGIQIGLSNKIHNIFKSYLSAYS